MPVDTGPRLQDSLTGMFGPIQSTTEKALVQNALCTVRYNAFVGSAITNTASTPLRVPLEYATLVQFRCEANTVKFIPNAALTADNTNATTLALVYNNGNGGGDTTIATINTATTAGGGSGNWTAGTGVALTVNTQVVVPVGSQVELKVTGAGTTPPLPQGAIVVHGRLA